ncbi:hypothetical protein EYY86_07745 [Hafnia paralvei]|uniref:hypothetical protein n=1 Tax=Hafnia paralvei TaxID=546367 RepID=UPI001034B8AE|nr:hypothetical protein [Hafnia paralvei]MBU2674009.1 hypothetical protein [Hafnia paralvei]TBM16234.1 hypothetical protein EYY86_07745 [Hafnia paralvei]TBM24736.1 hypothetical protein EYY85_14270 [Hafnia paralvei]
MKNIIVNELDGLLVGFESAIGYGIAFWAGKKPLSNPYKEIELDIDDHFEWEKDIYLINENEGSIKIRDNRLIFIAKIISYTDDGILIVSLDDDILFIEVSSVGDDIEGYVSFSTTPDKVTLYPVEL